MERMQICYFSCLYVKKNERRSTQRKLKKKLYNVNKAFKLVISIGKEEIEFSSRDLLRNLSDISFHKRKEGKNTYKTLRFGTFDIEEGMVVIQRLAPRNLRRKKEFSERKKKTERNWKEKGKTCSQVLVVGGGTVENISHYCQAFVCQKSKEKRKRLN